MLAAIFASFRHPCRCPLLPAFLFCNLFLTVIPEQAFFQGLLARALLLKLPLPAVMALIALLFAALHRGRRYICC